MYLSLPAAFRLLFSATARVAKMGCRPSRAARVQQIGASPRGTRVARGVHSSQGAETAATMPSKTGFAESAMASDDGTEIPGIVTTRAWDPMPRGPGMTTDTRAQPHQPHTRQSASQVQDDGCLRR